MGHGVSKAVWKMQQDGSRLRRCQDKVWGPAESQWHSLHCPKDARPSAAPWRHGAVWHPLGSAIRAEKSRGGGLGIPSTPRMGGQRHQHQGHCWANTGLAMGTRGGHSTAPKLPSPRLCCPGHKCVGCSSGHSHSGKGLLPSVHPNTPRACVQSAGCKILQLQSKGKAGVCCAPHARVGWQLVR